MDYHLAFYPFFSFALTFLSIRYLISEKSLIKIADIPNYRSLHKKPIQRTGGIAIFLGSIPAFVFFNLFGKNFYSERLILPLMGFFLVAAISLIDDIKNLKPLTRILFHFFSSLILILSNLNISNIYEFIEFFIILLSMVWFINLYNFMDGLDGLCGAMSLSGFVVYGIIFFENGYLNLFAFCLILACAVFAFLIFNFPPARIFLGDMGSVGLGYILSGLSFYGIIKGVFSPFVTLLVFLPFIWDATFTLIRRLLRGEKPWKAHREHFYQRLAMSGLGKKKSLYFYLFLIIICNLSVFFILKKSTLLQFFTLFFFILVLIIIEKFFSLYKLSKL